MVTPTRKRGNGGSRRSESRARAIWIGVAATVVLIGGLLAATGGSSNADSAPDIALPNFEGETVRLSDFEGQPLVVNYWASWCLPCLAELPGFEAVYQSRKGSVGFLGINLADDPTRALRVAADTGISYPLAIDVDGSSYTEFGGFVMPTTIFIDAEGNIVELYSGDLTAGELEARIERHFGG